MKPYLLFLASTGALLLSACGGKITNVKQPAWTDPMVCQKEMPAATDYTPGEPIGTPDTVVFVRVTDKQIYLDVVNPKQGTVEQSVKVNPDDYIQIVDPMEDRIAGGIYRPPGQPPPPPPGQDYLRYITRVASRINETAPSQCMPMQPGAELGGKVQ